MFFGFAACGFFGFAACGFFCFEAGLFGAGLFFGFGAGLFFGFAACGFFCFEAGVFGGGGFGLGAGVFFGFAASGLYGFDAGSFGCFGFGASALLCLAPRSLLRQEPRLLSLGVDARSLGLGLRARLLQGGEPRDLLGLEARTLGFLGLPACLRLGLGSGALGRGGLLRCLGLAACCCFGFETLRVTRAGFLSREVGHRMEGNRRSRCELLDVVTQLAKLRAPDLAARRLRELLDERDRAGVLVRRSDRFDMVLELDRQGLSRLVSRSDDDECLDDLTAIGIGYADHGALRHGRMLEQGALDLERPDAVCRRENHIVRAADEPQVPLLVADRAVAGDVPAVTEHRVGLVRVVPVAAEQCGGAALERDVALGPWNAAGTRLVDHRDVVALRRQSHGARPDRDTREVRDEQRVLGLPVSVVDCQSKRVLEPRDHLRVERLPRRHRMSELGQMRRREAVELREHPVLGRRLAEHGDAEPVEKRESLLRIERTLVDDDLGALRPWPEQHVPDRLRPAGAGRAPDDIVLLRIEPLRRLHPLRPGVRVGVHHALWLLRRPRRVEDQRALACSRLLGGRHRQVRRQLVPRLVDVEDRDDVADLVPHLLDLGLTLPIGDHEPRPGMAYAESEVSGAEHVGARDRDQTAFDRPEHRPVPGGHLADDDQDAIAAIDPRPQQVGPPCRLLGDVRKGVPIDDALVVDEGERAAQWVLCPHLDDITGEVEGRGDVPAGGERPGSRDLALLSTAESHGHRSCQASACSHRSR